jgi:hypothetical protein
MTNLEPINPVEIESLIRQTSNNISKGVRVVSDRLGTYREAERLYDLAFAKAYMRHAGAAHEKKFAAEIATETERKTRDDAEVAFKYAERQMKALESELSAWQTINKTISQMFSASGHMGIGS